MNITFIGAGNMAEALVAGIIEKGVCAAERITVTDIADARLKHFDLMYGVHVSQNNAEAVAEACVVVLAVKPQVFPEVWPDIAKALKPDTLVISIMAGVTSKAITGDSSTHVVRVMPNTPSLIGRGAAGIAAGEFATEADLLIAEKILSAVGEVATVDEQDIDAVTALSGSGPAYVFYLIESMMEAAERMGLNESDACTLALETVGGAAELMKHSGEKAADLRKKVTSKGGTTEAALRVMEEQGVKESIISALFAAQARSQELAKG